MKKVLLLVVALIVYGSFYPWRFEFHALPANPLWMLMHSLPDVPSIYAYRDAAVNFTLYLPFGMLCFLTFSETRSRISSVLVTVAGSAMLSASIEMVQLFTPSRVCSLYDVAFNLAGAAAGIPAALVFGRPITRLVRQTEAAGVFRLSAVIALLYLWTGYLLFPFFPAMSRAALRGKVHEFLSSPIWRPQDFWESFGGWLAAAALLESLAGRRHWGKWISLAMLLIPLKLLLAQRTMSQAEIAGAAAGVVAWILIRGPGESRLVAGGLAAAALVAGGLMPWDFVSTPQPFVWTPFLPMLQAPWEAGLLALLRKSFLYGSAMWLLHGKRLGWRASCIMVAVLLAGVEAVQVFLPGRTPELTDPLLALLLAYSLAQLERQPVPAPRRR